MFFSRLISATAIAATVALLPLLVTAQTPRRSPAYNHDFEFPLPIIPVKQPSATYTNPETGVPIDFYEVKIQSFTRNLFPDLGNASLIGYDGIVPGPTFKVERGRETLVRFVNEADRSMSVHLHGSYTWDGWAGDMILPGQYKDYYYPNKQNARTLWYHDHAMAQTTVNVYAGLAGLYILQDSALEASLGLPQGNYDVPLLITSRFYTAAGNITDESAERTSTYGDTFSVNGQILPYLSVEPRKYRFRILNVAVSRAFNLSLEDFSVFVPFWVVGSDGGFMVRPVETRSLVLSMAERWEIIVDFSGFEGKNLTLKQTNIFADTDFVGTDKVMQFRVGSTVSNKAGNGPLPTTLVALDFPHDKSTIDQTFIFSRAIGRPWTINGQVFPGAQNRILRNVPRGTTEKWLLSGSGGWSHPVHVHLVDFQIVSRGVGNPNQSPGRTTVEEYERVAVKDIAVLGTNEEVIVLAKYAVHEDHDMMATFNVSALSDFGYPEKTHFEDPMEARFLAKPYTGTDLASVQNELLAFYADLDAYRNVPGVLSALDQYWATKNGGTPTATRTSSAVSLTGTGLRLDARCGVDFEGATCVGGGFGDCCSQNGYE
ncbi:hypothetical protein RUND412_005363 [Rhizina undulata]